MSFPSSPRVPSGPRRRSLLASAAGAALLAGCSGGSGSDTAPAPSADERARARAARDSEVLAARYDAVIAAHPGLAARLRPLRDEVVRHAEAFGGGARTASPTASPSGTARAAGPGDGAGVPVTEKEALAGLAAAERELADRRAGALLEAPGESARLLASVAAAGAAHMFLLTEGHG
ncbi:hypothetical protein [Streptomyces flaveolus]|uniref:hypothetical protein n=1 Tax=Streptomyces flaveolus TaxID=67297 RepID=UPI0016706A36|nr:hypothetical protein [Streptomyces flaveolus]GGQ87794.1 lipoprotein [Streptomyces flaveolus]